MTTKKLTPQEVKQFEKILRTMLAVLNGDIQSLEKDALGDEIATPTYKGEDGGDAFSQELSLELLERDETTLREVMGALDRIGDGTFGRCETCEKGIGKLRLNAVPFARNCIECQRQQEHGLF
jgi:RNA polymerase-binding transcription factor DksA